MEKENKVLKQVKLRRFRRTFYLITLFRNLKPLTLRKVNLRLKLKFSRRNSTDMSHAFRQQDWSLESLQNREYSTLASSY